MKYTPWMLIILRALLPVPIWFIAQLHAPGYLVSICILIAALSDVYDGEIARKTGSTTPALRRTDGVVDLFFLTSTVILFIIYHASIGTGAAAAIALMFLLSIAGHAIALIRFKHSAAVHSKMMKIYAVFAYVGFFFAWISGSLIPWVFIALAAGIIAEVERFWILIRSKTEPIDISTMADINHPIASLKTALFKKGDSSCS